MRGPLTQYRSLTADNARWDGFSFRDDDIIISAPIKCGSTWTQMICALLIFQSRTFPATLDEISPWVDMLTRPLADVVRVLNAQVHRRFIKSHTPLDGLPFHERVTYVCVGRDPRDVALSFDNHMANLNMDAFLTARYCAVGLDGTAEFTRGRPGIWPPSQKERFWRWIEEPEPLGATTSGLRAMVHHISTFWEARTYANVVLLHFDDLRMDLEGQMRQLAARLGIFVPQEVWTELVQTATFDEMRRRADDLVPNVTHNLWHDNAQFFNKGTSGQWMDLLDGEDVHRYRTRIM